MIVYSFKKLLKRTYFYIFRIYIHRVWVDDAQGLKEKLPIFLKSLWKTFIDRKFILFYPDEPKPHHVMYKMLSYLGYHYSTNPSVHCSIAIKWWKGSDGNPFPPKTDVLTELQKRIGRDNVLNNQCKDITKERVANVFEEVFGYSLSIDPLTHKGKCVTKSNWNALHLGRIIECPISISEHIEGYVYERLIHNEIYGSLVEDIRVPYLVGEIPFVYVKHRLLEKRFIDRDIANKNAYLKDVNELFSKSEIENICLFCERINLDYCELDVLRDKYDGRIYIVDANATPAGPPSNLTKIEEINAVLQLSENFSEIYKC